MNFSWASLVNAIYSVFGDSVYIDTNGAMHMTYFIPQNMTALLTAMVSKKILPRPLGVTISGLVPIIDENSGLASDKYFGFFDADISNSDILNLNIGGYLDLSGNSYNLISEIEDMATLTNINNLNYASPSTESGIWLDAKNIIDA